MADSFINRLEVEGHRVTSTRRAVAQAVSGRTAPFTAEELCDEVPRVGRATVYRNIKLLQDMGFLCRVLLEDGSPRYQPSQHAHHHHLVCVSCGEVQDFVDCDLSELLRPVVRESGFEVAGHRLEVFGRCARCRGRASPN